MLTNTKSKYYIALSFILLLVTSVAYVRIKKPELLHGRSNNATLASVEGKSTQFGQELPSDEFFLDRSVLAHDSGNIYAAAFNKLRGHYYLVSLKKDGGINWKRSLSRPETFISNPLITQDGDIVVTTETGLALFSPAGDLKFENKCFDRSSIYNRVSLLPDGGFLSFGKSVTDDGLVFKCSSNGERERSYVISDSTSTTSLTPLIDEPIKYKPYEDRGGTPLSDWSYYSEIQINNYDNEKNLENYQIYITINTLSLINSGKMKTDCGDIRFLDSSRKIVLPYWIETGCNTASTKIWVKIPRIDSKSFSKFYLYMGNPSAYNASNTRETFIREIMDVEAAWTLDETSGSTISDSSGNAGSGAVYGTTVVEGKFGNAKEFDERSDRTFTEHIYLITDYTTVLLTNFTFEAWVFPKKTAVGTGGTSGQSYVLYPDHPGEGGGECGDPGTHGGSGLSVASNVITVVEHAPCYIPARLIHNVPIDGWTHVVMIYEGNRPSVYINGAFGKLGTQSTRIIGMGRHLGDATPPNSNYGPYDGTMDEVRMYNRVLTPEEIYDLYNNFGYVTPNYPGKSLVRKYSKPEPTTVENTGVGRLVVSGTSTAFGSFYGRGFRALDLKTGSTIWSSTEGEGFSNPLLSEDEKIVVAADSGNTLNAFDTGTGTLIWSLDIGTDKPSLARGKNNVLYTTKNMTSTFDSEGPSLYALDIQSGKTIWKKSLKSLLEGVEIIVYETDGKELVYLVEPTGNLISISSTQDSSLISGLKSAGYYNPLHDGKSVFVPSAHSIIRLDLGP